MVDVLLTHSYHLYYDRKQTRKMQPYPPLGTLYAAALLRRYGISVALFDTMLNDPEQEFQSVLDCVRPKIVVVYEDNFNFLSKMCLSRMREVAYSMAHAAQERGAQVLINGSDACDHATDYLREGFCCVLLGEAEWTLLDVVQQLLHTGIHNIGCVAGLAYIQQSTGNIVKTLKRSVMRNLDLLPHPARDLVDMEQYRSRWTSAHGYFSLNITSSRGCPYGCNWCAKPIYGSSFGLRSAVDVAKEMHELKYTYGAGHLWFADDIFGLKANWVSELAHEVENLDAAVPFKMQSRVDLMTRDTVCALRRAGCAEVWMGVESGSQKILDAMEKGTHVEQIAVAREHLQEHGIRACYFLQFGYPGETWDDIYKTVEIVRATRPDDIGVSVSYPLPGTKFHQKVSAELGEKRNWSDSEDLAMMFHGTYTNEFYHALHDALHAEVDHWSDGLRTDKQNVEQLWRTVEQLEPRCRNPKPTLSQEHAPEAIVPLRVLQSRVKSPSAPSPDTNT